MILGICVIFNTAAMYDLLSSPLWVRIVSNKRDGTIRLTSKIRSFHFFEQERKIDDLIDVVAKANQLVTQNKREAPEIISHTIALVFQDGRNLYFNVNLGSTEHSHEARHYLQQLDDFHFNGLADRNSAALPKDLDFQYFDFGIMTHLLNTFLSLLASTALFMASDFLAREETEREYGF